MTTSKLMTVNRGWAEIALTVKNMNALLKMLGLMSMATLST